MCAAITLDSEIGQALQLLTTWYGGPHRSGFAEPLARPRGRRSRRWLLLARRPKGLCHMTYFVRRLTTDRF
jgi:hypothetical protein